MIYKKAPSFVNLIFLCFASFSLLAQGVQVEKRLGTTAAGFGYLEYLPTDYTGTSKKFPTIIFLHGVGEKGNGTTDLPKLTVNGPPKLIKAGQWPVKSPITGLYPAENFIVISPQSANGFPSPASLHEFITYLINTYRVDPNRVYLTGLSAGGVSVFNYIKTYVDQVAAVIPISGNGLFTVSKACFFKDIPLWAFHGDKDATTAYTNSTGIVEAINNCVPSPNPKAKVTIYNGVGHDAWTRTYNLTGMSAFDPKYDAFSISIYDWLLLFKKSSGNTAPTANAGTDITLTSPASTVTITGVGTAGTGTISSYAWTKISGPNVNIQNNASATVTLKDLTTGNYIFRFTVTNSSGLQASDDVVVNVLAANVAPTANAGADQVITFPASSVTLAGSGSDSDGTIVSYAWTLLSGGSFTWSGASTSTLTLSALKVGVYEFRLTVTDDKGATSFDDVKITVSSTIGIAPVANAGPDKLIKLPSAAITIVGEGTDADGTIASYLWTKISGPAVTLTNETTARLKVSNLVSGVAIFRLKVTDNSGNTAEDDVTVKFNYPPVANAGVDQMITLSPTLTVTLPGMGTDTDGTIQSYSWSKVSGPSVTLNGNATSTLLLGNLNEGIYEFKLIVVDNMGSSATDNVMVTVQSNSVLAIASTSGTATLFNSEAGTSAIIYDDLGKKIFEGEWNSDVSTQVMEPNKIHYYRLYKDGRKIGSGKVFIVK